MRSALVRGRIYQTRAIAPPIWLAAPAALYLLALVLLTVNIGGHPAFPYNWEEYSIRGVLRFWEQPGWGIFEIRQGLMSNSGESPLIALPAWVAFKLNGVSLASMRLPAALLSALAVPMLWIFARRVAGTAVASLAASLLLLSPVFLLYGRTATLVGLSMPLALATLYFLLRLLKDPAGWRWLAALQICLLVGAYAYAPIRFLWLISLGLLAYELAVRVDLRRALARSILVTAIVLPLFLSVITWTDPGTATGKYFYARGEQVITLSYETERYRFYLDEIDRNDVEATQRSSPAELALTLVGQNVVDLGNLLTDFDTDPVLLRHWRPEARFYPWFLLPFFAIGLVQSIRQSRRLVEHRLLLIAFLGFTLPLLLTSKVHAGRLIFALPLLCIFVAAGFAWLAGWLQVRFASRANIPAVIAVSTVLLVGAVAFTTWRDYRTAPPPTVASQTASALEAGREAIRQSGGVGVLILDGSRSQISLAAAEFQLRFIDSMRFQDGNVDRLNTANAQDSRATVVYGLGTDELMSEPLTEDLCRNVYFIDHVLVDEFLDTHRAALEKCGEPPIYWKLQDHLPPDGPLSMLQSQQELTWMSLTSFLQTSKLNGFMARVNHDDRHPD